MGLQVVCFPIFVGYQCILQYTFDFFLLVITRISSVVPCLFAIVAMCSPEISPYLYLWKCGIPKIKDIKIKENYDEKVCPDFFTNNINPNFTVGQFICRLDIHPGSECFFCPHIYIETLIYIYICMCIYIYVCTTIYIYIYLIIYV